VSPEQTAPAVGLEEPLAPKRARFEEFWRLFRRNRMALAGMVVFAFFFFSAVIGLALTSGSRPLFDPSQVRLPEKLLPPLSAPHIEVLKPEERPPLGVYLFGTDDLGRDVFAAHAAGRVGCP